MQICEPNNAKISVNYPNTLSGHQIHYVKNFTFTMGNVGGCFEGNADDAGDTVTTPEQLKELREAEARIAEQEQIIKNLQEKLGLQPSDTPLASRHLEQQVPGASALFNTDRIRKISKF